MLGFPQGESLNKQGRTYWLLTSSRLAWKPLQSKGEWAFADGLSKLAETLNENDSANITNPNATMKEPAIW